MKNVICLILAGITINCACAQTTLPEHEWKVTLKVVDETGQPVVGAKADVGYYSHSTPASINGLTDTNGIFTASHRAHSGILGFSAEKAGYYMTREPSYDLGFTYDPVKWNQTQTIVLKKIGRSIPMYAKHVEKGPPIFNKPVGYDLMTGDWVAPYGKGQTTDIIFTAEYHKKSSQDYDYKLTVSFPNPGDGIQQFQVPYKMMEGSTLRSLHEAPETGYSSQLERLNVSHPGQKPIFDYDENRTYFFRVRTVLNENGNIKSTLYGKIYGDFMQFHYYLNPTPNSRNVEFDPKRNLLKNLSDMEGVSQP